MKLYIVIHIIYLCEKPDSVDFPRKNSKFFESFFSIFRINFLHISDVFFLPADGFLSNGSLIPSHFHAYNCNSARFFLIFQIKRPNFLIQKRIFKVNFLHISDVFFLQADGFLSNGSLIPSHFHAYNCNSARFFLIFQIKRPNFLIQKRIFKVNFLHISDVFFLQADGFLSNGSLIPSHFHAYNCNSASFCLIFQIKRPNFLIQKRIFRVNFLHISDVFLLQADGFLSNGSLIPSHFHAYKCNSARFFLIFQIKHPNFLIQKRIFRVNFLHISDMFSSYKQMIFSAMEA